jgi:tetratricopeptide (TPR) repeat protein
MKMGIVTVFMLLALINVGYCQYQGKDESLEAAMKEFQQAIEKKSDYAEAHYNLGIVYSEKGMVEDAINEYKKTLAINPQFSDTYYTMGVAYAKKDQLEESVKSLQKALDLNQNDDKSHFALGVIYQTKRKAKVANGKSEKP